MKLVLMPVPENRQLEYRVELAELEESMKGCTTWSNFNRLEIQLEGLQKKCQLLGLNVDPKKEILLSIIEAKARCREMRTRFMIVAERRRRENYINELQSKRQKV